jgi:hypothetical protein
VSRQFAVLYSAIGAVALVAVFLSAGWSPFLPLAVALPFLVVYLAFDIQRRGRSWQAEVAGPIALSSFAAAIGLTGGMSWPPAVALWGVMVARAVPSVLYIRTRLRLAKGENPLIRPVIGIHVLAVVFVAGAAARDLLPLLAVAAVCILLVRAAWGLSRYRRRVATRVLGFAEIGLGALTVGLVALGIALDL